MIRRVCPICDQVMTGRHYCRICHSWVRHPRIQDVTYYLNERHPQNETACSYHDFYHDSLHRQEDSAGSKMKKSGKKDGKKGDKKKTEKTVTVWRMGNPSQPGKKNNQKSSKPSNPVPASGGNYRSGSGNDWEETFGNRTDKSKKEGSGRTIGAFSLFLILIVFWRLFLAIWSVIQAFLVW